MRLQKLKLKSLSLLLVSSFLIAGCAKDHEPLPAPIKLVDLSQERCPPADPLSVAQGKTVVQFPKPDMKDKDGKLTMHKPETVRTVIENHEHKGEGDNRAIARLAQNHEACRTGKLPPPATSS